MIDDPDGPDPKAPKMVWVHWVVYNIPPATKSFPENVGKAGLPRGTILALNDFQKREYGGPCPKNRWRGAAVGRKPHDFEIYVRETAASWQRSCSTP
jgi:phosphatidylethanolamine-binding protein (PEBP) family uncharacterized protein